MHIVLCVLINVNLGHWSRESVNTVCIKSNIIPSVCLTSVDLFKSFQVSQDDVVSGKHQPPLQHCGHQSSLSCYREEYSFKMRKWIVQFEPAEETETHIVVSWLLWSRARERERKRKRHPDQPPLFAPLRLFLKFVLLSWNKPPGLCFGLQQIHVSGWTATVNRQTPLQSKQRSRGMNPSRVQSTDFPSSLSESRINSCARAWKFTSTVFKVSWDFLQALCEGLLFAAFREQSRILPVGYTTIRMWCIGWLPVMHFLIW